MNQRKGPGDFSAQALLLEYLELVRDYVAAGEQHIAQQKQLIGQLRTDGDALMGAIEYLSGLETSQAMQVACRNRLERDLAAANPE